MKSLLIFLRVFFIFHCVYISGPSSTWTFIVQSAEYLSAEALLNETVTIFVLKTVLPEFDFGHPISLTLIILNHCCVSLLRCLQHIVTMLNILFCSKQLNFDWRKSRWNRLCVILP